MSFAMAGAGRRPPSSSRPQRVEPRPAEVRVEVQGEGTSPGAALPGAAVAGMAPTANTNRAAASPRASAARSGSGPTLGTGRMTATRTPITTGSSPLNSSASAGSRSPPIGRTPLQDLASPSKGSSPSPPTAGVTTPRAQTATLGVTSASSPPTGVSAKDFNRTPLADQGLHTPLRRLRQNDTPQRETPRGSGSRGLKASSRQSSRADLSPAGSPGNEVLPVGQARSPPLGVSMRVPLSSARSSRPDLHEVPEPSANSASTRKRELPASSRDASPSGRSMSPSPYPKNRAEHTSSMVGRKQVMMGPTTRSKMGGRMVGISYPKDIWAKEIKDASEEKLNRMRRRPREELICEYAYGYNSQVRKNIFSVGERGTGSSSVSRATTPTAASMGDSPKAEGKIGPMPKRYVYAAASFGVVWDVEDNTQQFFTGHSKEVISIAYNEALRICATAQRFPGRVTGSGEFAKKQEEPLMRICVWTIDDQMERMRLQSTTCCADYIVFSTDGKWLFSVGGGQPTSKSRTFGTMQITRENRDSSPRSGRCESEERHRNSTQNAIFVWQMNEFVLRNHSAQVSVHEVPRHILTRVIDASTGLTPHPSSADKLICCGPTCVSFLSGIWGVGVPGGDPESEVHRAVYTTDSLEEQAHGFTAATYCPNCTERALASTENGLIFVYETSAADGYQCSRASESLAGNSINFLEWSATGLLIAGGSDCGISFLRLDASGDLKLLQRCPLRAPTGAPMVPHAAQVWEGPAGGLRLLVGTTGGELAMVDINDYCPQVSLVQRHPWHEVRGAIAVHPSHGSIFAVGDASGCIWFYDCSSRIIVQAQPYICQAPVRCMDWDPHGHLLACGLENGRIEVVMTIIKDKPQKASSGAPAAEETVTVEALFLHTAQVLPSMPGGEPNCINDIRFSPAKDEGRWVACGCRDGRVVIFSVLHSDVISDNAVNAHCVRHRVLTGNSSAVLYLQFSNDGTQVCANGKDGQLVTWDVESGEWRYPASTAWSEEGHPFRLTMAWETLGIWNSDKYDYTGALVAASDWSTKFMAVGDHHGLVKLHQFKLPIANAESRDYMGHCSRVSGVAWTPTGKLLTVGTKPGDCVIQWGMSPTHAAALGSPKEWEQKSGDGSPNSVIVQTLDGGQGVTEAKTPGTETIYEDDGITQAGSTLTCDAGVQANSYVTPPETPPVTPVLELTSSSKLELASSSKFMPASSLSPRRLNRSESSPSPRSGPHGQRLSSMESLPSPRTTTHVRTLASVESSPRLHSESTTTTSTSLLRMSSSEASLLQGIHTWPAVIKRSASGSLRLPSPASRVSAAQTQRVMVRQVSTAQVRQISPPRTQTPLPTAPTQAISLSGSAAPSAPAPAPRPASTTSPMIVKPPPSSFSVRVLEVSSGRTISSAMVYLYHPPFPLEAAVEYIQSGTGAAVELFWPPRGWGVLRSSAGLLLWLSLSVGSLLEDSLAMVSADSQGAKSGSQGLLRFDFEAAGGSTASVEATLNGRAEGHKQLMLDEGLLHPHDGRGLHVHLASNFDLVVKDWLSSSRARAAQGQSTSSGTVVLDKPQRVELQKVPNLDPKILSVASATKAASIMRSFTS